MSDPLSKMLAERNAALVTLDMDYARRMLPTASSDEVRLLAMARHDTNARTSPPNCATPAGTGCASAEASDWTEVSCCRKAGCPCRPTPR